MYQKCNNCNSVTPDCRKFGSKHYCATCSNSNLAHSKETPDKFTVHHVAEAVGFLINQINARLTEIERVLKIDKPENKIQPIPDKKKSK